MNEDTPDNVYILLFNGRATPTEDYEGRSLGNVYIGPVGFSMTYGTIKIHPPDWGDMIELPIYDDCVWMDGIFYSDVEVHREPAPKDPFLGATRIISWLEAARLIERRKP